MNKESSASVGIRIVPNSILTVRENGAHFRLSVILTRDSSLWGLAPLTSFKDLPRAEILLPDGRRLGTYRRAAIQENIPGSGGGLPADSYQDVSQLMTTFDIDEWFTAEDAIGNNIRWPEEALPLARSLKARVVSINDNSVTIGRVVSTFYHFGISPKSEVGPKFFRNAIQIELRSEPDPPALGTPMLSSSGHIIGAVVAAKGNHVVVCPLDTIMKRNHLSIWRPKSHELAFTLPPADKGTVADVVSGKAGIWGDALARARRLRAEAEIDHFELGNAPENLDALNAGLSLFIDEQEAELAL